MKDALTRLLSSAKFWTMLIGLSIAIGARWGFAVDSEVMWMIAGLTATLVGAQGLTDHGKSAAAITAATPAAPTTQIAAGDITNPPPVRDERDVVSGEIGK